MKTFYFNYQQNVLAKETKDKIHDRKKSDINTELINHTKNEENETNTEVQTIQDFIEGFDPYVSGDKQTESAQDQKWISEILQKNKQFKKEKEDIQNKSYQEKKHFKVALNTTEIDDSLNEENIQNPITGKHFSKAMFYIVDIHPWIIT